jgi:AAA domain
MPNTAGLTPGDVARTTNSVSPSVGAPWRAILERACRDAARDIRTGEPVVTLLPRRAPNETRYLVPKLLLAGETNLAYADGGHGKSLLALAIGVAAATQTTLPGGLRPSARVPVMLLDWESYRGEHEDRLARYCEGLDVTEPPQILYRPMTRALADEITRIRAEVARHHVGLVIVDSFAPACAAEPEGSDAAIRLMNALRSLAPATRLLLAHVSKASAEARTGLARAFGSVFVMNLARNAWELRRADEDGGSDLVLAAFHRKANAGPLLPPLGFRFQFQPNMTTLHAHDIGQAPELAARASLAFRIRTALANGSRTAANLAETIEASEESVSRTLRRLTTKGVVIQLGDRKPFAWGLAR